MSTMQARTAVPYAEPAPEFTFGDFLRLLWRRRLLVLAGALLGLAAAVVYLNRATYKYTVELRVSPVESRDGGLLGRLGGLASVAGIDLPKGEEASGFDYYLEALYAPEVSRVLARDPAIMRGAFAREWGPAGWREPRGAVGDLAKSAKRLLGIPVYPWTPPDADRLNDWLLEHVEVIKNNKEALVTVAVRHEDPRFATNLLEQLDRAADRAIRAKTLARTGGTIAYLQRKLGQVLLAEHREALAEALGEQERRRMMASANVAFAAERFGDVKVSPRPTSPKPAVILAAGLVGGAGLGVLAALLAAARRRSSLPEDRTGG